MSTLALLRPAARAALRQTARPSLKVPPSDGGLSNILSGGDAPAVQVKTITPNGIQLADGLILPSACIFLDGKVFLWNVPEKTWDDWKTEHFEIFETVVPKPEILLLGTGERVEMVPPHLRQYLNMPRNACSTYNLLTEEGRRVAAALLPLTPRRWQGAPPA
ncbi:NADH dehydrogenase 1 alpha subcomplex assembly factor 3 [Cerioporus squamosus]|nr:NADH dehydrogenase 1 alpha subcomplex assembly factor 3 [Cerioporus squamosus]